MRALLLLVVLAAAAFAAWWWLAPGAAPGDAPASGSELERLAADAERLHALEDHARSEVAYARAAAEAAEAGDWKRHFALRAQRGVCLKMLGRTEEARAELLPALEWARQNDDLRTEGLALGNLARVAEIDGDIDTALERMEQLVDVAEAGNDARTVVLSLEQIAALQLRRGAPLAALERLDRAEVANAELPPEEDRGHALARQRAWALALRGDAEGALALWAATPPSAAGEARRAETLSELGLHVPAADAALEAAQAFAAEDPPRPGPRDDALALHVDQLLRAGELDAAAARLADWLDGEASDAARAPFELLEGRLAWLRGDVARAASLFAAARAGATDAPVAAEAGWLEALALDELGRGDEARAVAEQLPPSPAATLVRAWLLRDDADEPLATSAVPGLSDVDAAHGDGSLARLRAASPRALPSLSWLALHLHLADGDRLVERGREDLREQFVQRGLRVALRWRLREQVHALLERWPAPDTMAPFDAALEPWFSGELPLDEAVLVVLTGPTLSYLALFSSEWPGTCFGLAPGPELERRAAAVSGALRTGDAHDVAAEGHRLFRLLFGTRARQDLDGKRLLSFLLPEELAGVPPALLVSAEPLPGMLPRWLVLERDLRLIALPVAASRAEPGDGVLRMDAPAVDPDASQLVLPQLVAAFGDGVLHAGPLPPRPGDARELRGLEATAGALRAAGGLRRWELGVSAAGTGRVGGLLLAPDPSAPWADERAGVLSWSRLAELDLPPQLLLDRSRFDPLGGGTLRVATAAALGGARTLLLTRWPLPDTLRDGQLGEDPSDALTPAGLGTRLRAYLQAASGPGAPAGATHPRVWAAWMLFGGEPPAQDR